MPFQSRQMPLPRIHISPSCPSTIGALSSAIGREYSHSDHVVRILRPRVSEPDVQGSHERGSLRSVAGQRPVSSPGFTDIPARKEKYCPPHEKVQHVLSDVRMNHGPVGSASQSEQE